MQRSSDPGEPRRDTPPEAPARTTGDDTPGRAAERTVPPDGPATERRPAPGIRHEPEPDAGNLIPAEDEPGTF